VANGGTGATAAANAASGVVVLNGSSQLPAVSGALLTNLPAQAPTQVNDTDAGTALSTTIATILSVAKTITSGKTVLLIATGYVRKTGGTAIDNFTLVLKQGSTTVQTIIVDLAPTLNGDYSWAASGIVTGVSGSITFSVTGILDGFQSTGTAYGNLEVIEF